MHFPQDSRHFPFANPMSITPIDNDDKPFLLLEQSSSPRISGESSEQPSTAFFLDKNTATTRSTVVVLSCHQ
jgi:hypothetical protein